MTNCTGAGRKSKTSARTAAHYCAACGRPVSLATDGTARKHQDRKASR